jgi:hypothetical protein
MNSEDILKLRDKQINSFSELREKAIKYETTTTEQNNATLLLLMSENHWLAEIAYQLSVRNEMLFRQQYEERLKKLEKNVGEKSLLERIFGKGV